MWRLTRISTRYIPSIPYSASSSFSPRLHVVSSGTITPTTWRRNESSITNAGSGGNDDDKTTTNADGESTGSIPNGTIDNVVEQATTVPVSKPQPPVTTTTTATPPTPTKPVASVKTTEDPTSTIKRKKKTISRTMLATSGEESSPQDEPPPPPSPRAAAILPTSRTPKPWIDLHRSRQGGHHNSDSSGPRSAASAVRPLLPRTRTYRDVANQSAYRYMKRVAATKTSNREESLARWQEEARHFAPSPPSRMKIAMLIDAENVAYKHMYGIMEEVRKLGSVGVKRIYADWTSELMRGWRPLVLTNALTPIQMFESSLGKGNSDSALIVDAMELLYTKKDIDAFCIVSSDADFTRLATKLREEGKNVMGIGSNKTPAPFICACDRFVYIHNLPVDPHMTTEDQFTNSPTKHRPTIASSPSSSPSPAGGDFLLNSVAPITVPSSSSRVSTPPSSPTTSSPQPPPVTTATTSTTTPRPSRKVASSTATTTTTTTTTIKEATATKEIVVGTPSQPPPSTPPTTTITKDIAIVPSPPPPPPPTIPTLTPEQIAAAEATKQKQASARLACMIITRAWSESRSEAGWAPIPAIVKNLESIEFDPQVHGFSTVEEFVMATIEQRKQQDTTTTTTTESNGTDNEYGFFDTRRTEDGVMLLQRRAMML